MLRVFSSLAIPSYLTMLGCDRLFTRSTSFMSCEISSSLRPSRPMRLTATIWPVFRFSALYTAPNCPLPIQLPSCCKRHLSVRSHRQR